MSSLEVSQHLETEYVEHSRLESQMGIAAILRDERSAIAIWLAIDASDRRIAELKKADVPDSVEIILN